MPQIISVLKIIDKLLGVNRSHPNNHVKLTEKELEFLIS